LKPERRGEVTNVRLRLSVSAASLGLLVVSASAAATSPHAPRVKEDGQAQARAHAIVLTAADFPSGWVSDTKWQHESVIHMFDPDQTCRAVDPDLSGTTVAGRWSQSHINFVGGKVLGGVLHGVFVFARPSQAVLVLRRWALPWATRCNGIGGRTQSGVVDSVRRYRPDAPGTQAYGFRLATREGKQRGHSELIFMQAGPRLSIFLVYSTRTFDRALERRLTRSVARRMTAGIA
jgi:hypothetical protein